MSAAKTTHGAVAERFVSEVRPHATRGFFQVRSAIPEIIRTVGCAYLRLSF